MAALSEGKRSRAAVVVCDHGRLELFQESSPEAAAASSTRGEPAAAALVVLCTSEDNKDAWARTDRASPVSSPLYKPRFRVCTDPFKKVCINPSTTGCRIGT